MSALYIMRINTQSRRSAGAIYIGKGLVAGVDTGEVRFDGTYTEAAGRLKGAVTMTRPRAKPVEMGFDWPATLDDGAARSLVVEGLEVGVTFEKLKDIP